MVTRIYSSKPSKGAKALAQELGIKQIKVHGSSYRGTPGNVLINWGSTSLHQVLLHPNQRTINDPEKVKVASNKLKFFQLAGNSTSAPRIPDFTVSPVEAKAWQDSGKTVVARAVLTGHSGAGITICPEGVDIPLVPLYTIYVPKKDEYRLHCVKSSQSGEVTIFDAQRKARRPGHTGDYNTRVRNLLGGYVYVRGSLQVPEDVRTQTLNAFRLSGLHFGAVDVLWNEKSGRAFVLEINTAPGLEGTTVTNYANAFKEYLL